MNQNRNIFLAIVTGIVVFVMCIVYFPSLFGTDQLNNVAAEGETVEYNEEYEDNYDDEEVYDGYYEEDYTEYDESQYVGDEDYFDEDYYEEEYDEEEYYDNFDEE